MREISIYEMVNDCDLMGTKNLNALSKKMQEDAVTFNQIEKDYNNDKEKFKEEYRAAKRNYLINQYKYCWLILKRYFAQAIPHEIRTFPDFQKEEMRKKGWMFPHYFINQRIIFTGEYGKNIEGNYIECFNSDFDNIFNFTIGVKNSRADRYFQQAVYAYKNECYFSCVVSLFPIIESYHQYMTGFNEDKFYKIKENLNKLDEKIQNVNQVFATEITYYKKLVDQFDDLVKNHYFKTSLERDEEPEIINRNRIMHGIFMREISQKDCLQLFCVLSNMVVIKNIIDASDRMNSIEEELKTLNAEIR